jgi:CHAT domain-containing protein
LIVCQLLAPILEELDPGITHLLLSPEGNLHLIPFAALVNPQGRYLLADYQLTYLNSGRDLLRLGTQPAAQNPPLLVAAPDYQHTADTDAIAQTRAILTPRALELRDLQVTPLPGTLAEVNAIAPLLDNAQVKLAGEATENAVKAARSPQILHIATHGFFLRDPDFAALTDTLELPRQAFGQFQNGAQPFFNQGNIWRQEHPLLRSGLALAGFNQRQSGSEDGVLTALEISSLDLRGTQLAVLSACETGLGETPVGQGVYGLRRALSIAGAQSQVISLWQVDDRATQELMVNYYQALNQGQGRSEALRQARLAMARSADYSHPFYWAAFIPSGDWRPLQ